MKVTRLVVIGICFVFGLSMVACSSTSESKPAKTSQRSTQGNSAPKNTKLSRVQEGMNDLQVEKILGRPSNKSRYQTGKAWIPFFFGSDTHREDWIYNGVGRVVFSRNRYSGDLRVIRVDYNPKEKRKRVD